MNIRALHNDGAADPARGSASARPTIAVISNPLSDGNKVHRGRVRQFCATRPEVAHFEINGAGDLERILARVASSDFRAIAINGGDGTVHCVLTRLFGEDAPAGSIPPIAVLPSGRTNLIAKDLGAMGDPIAALEHLIELADQGLSGHLVKRQLISLDTGDGPPAMGMFFAAGALAETLLYCRYKIYPLRLPNWLAHLLTVLAAVASVITNGTSRFLPPMPREARVAVGDSTLDGRFQVLMVSTLKALVLTGSLTPPRTGTLGLIAMERKRLTVVRSLLAAFMGRAGRKPIRGLHFVAGEAIRFDHNVSEAIMDGETFRAAPGRGIELRPGPNVRFVDLGRGLRLPTRANDEVPYAAAPATAQLATASPLWNSQSRS
jgi:diacylglycerol kinase family enzyme